MSKEIDSIKIIDLLKKYATNNFASSALAYYIAEKIFEKGHLYSDMGLSSRVELNKLMSENYPRLAALRPDTKRWKKYMFDEIGSIAPACYDCKDSQDCFKCDLLEMG